MTKKPFSFKAKKVDGVEEKRSIYINSRTLIKNKFCSNSISTSKYNVISFLPKFIFEQFCKYSNIFFLLMSLIQQLPGVSPTGRYTTLVPLLFILSISGIKEIVEDFKRKKSDHQINNKKVYVLKENSSDWQLFRWRHVQVGDIVKVKSEELFPADLFFLSSSEPNSICFIETSNLDGETNLKIRQSLKQTSNLKTVSDLKNLSAIIEYEPPNQNLYEFVGNLKIDEQRTIPINPDQILLRGSQLRNTEWIYGIVIYTGHETKLMKNSNSPPLKRSQIEKATNNQILYLFIILIVLSLVSTIICSLWVSEKGGGHWYIGFNEEDFQSDNFAYNFITFLLVYQNLIPISLQVTLELVRFCQAFFINWDEEMYDKENDFHAVARTSNLNEELGVVKYIFSDKTGTLTKNQMQLKRCSIAGFLYGSVEHEGFDSVELLNNLKDHKTSEVIKEFLTLLVSCHTVIPERKANNSEIIYQASSPDENAFVTEAKNMGIIFHTREPDRIKVNFLNEQREYEILNVIEFNSVRKRMTVIIRDPLENKIKLYCKGADNVILPRLSEKSNEFKDTTIEHLEEFAKEGLRTLILAYKEIDSSSYEASATSIQNRDEKVQEAAELIEKDLLILGATAIEDKLQDGVPETISMLKKAGIKIWVLTGDKLETAVNIGYSCRLLTEEINLVYLNEKEKIKEVLNEWITQLDLSAQSQPKYGLIIEGSVLRYLLSVEFKENFLKLAISSSVVICCRATPKNKAQIVEMIKKKTNCVTLAIGDGANDVSMIQAAHVGIGVYGREGTQALAASDYAIGQFQYLAKLLLVHGNWNYSRISKVILYSFYKNICLYLIELWFAFFNAFSGQILFERWIISLYNVIFTAAPPMALGLFDMPTQSSTMLEFPELYSLTSYNAGFNMFGFWSYFVNSVFHSCIVYFVSFGLLYNEVAFSNGQVGDYIFMGNYVYTFCVIAVCLKAGLETESWTIITHLSIWGSIGFWFVFLAIYSNIWPTFDIAPEMVGMDKYIFEGPIFWFGVLLVPILTLLPDIVYKVVRRTFFKTFLQEIQEKEFKKTKFSFTDLLSKSNIGRTTSILMNKLKKQKVKPKSSQIYRGFAFSQEENGPVKINWSPSILA
ncbi:unnamed protein product [Brachionus calyciflorus]|uniref:Phospholipid-transporting ATPase n=1 Tax=Brachionus calyciflorus TaxID=104777 RepID=A0A813W423_9BILA|nr:unnamed protein product [Brachionus calyciflorus]